MSRKRITLDPVPLPSMRISGGHISRPKRTLRERLSENLGLRVSSVVLACALWLFVAWSKEETFGVGLQLVLANVDRNLIVTGQSHDFVRVTLQGLPNSIAKLSLDKLRAAQIDMSRFLTPGESLVTIPERAVRFWEDPNIKVTSISPSNIRVVMERKQRKTVRILANTVGNLPDGFLLAGIEVEEPATVLSGPLKGLADIQAVYTEPIRLDGRVSPFRESTRLIAPTQENVAYAVTRFATVSVDIQPEMLSRTFEGLTLVYPSAMTPARMAATVTIRGPKLIVEGLGAASFQVRLPEPPVGKITAEIPVEVVGLPPGISVEKVDPPSVSVTVRPSTPLPPMTPVSLSQDLPPAPIP